MLQTESQLSDPEKSSLNTTAKKGPNSTSPSTTKNDTMASKDFSEKKEKHLTKAEASAFEWEDVKKARNRINSQRIRERERAQIANLEAERARLWLSNDAIKFQNRHFREIIAQILEIGEMKRNRAAMAGGAMGMRGPGATGPAALLGGLGAGPAAMHMLPGMNHNGDMMGARAGGLDAAGLFQNSRLAGAAGKGLGGLSDVDLLARHQATSMEVQNMMRQQAAMDRLGSAVAGGMGGLALQNGMNMNPTAGSPYGDMAESLRIRQLMLQQSGGASADGILSSMGGVGPVGAPIGNANINTGDLSGGIINGLSGIGGTGLGGDMGGSGMENVDIFSMNKRQKLGRR